MRKNPNTQWGTGSRSHTVKAANRRITRFCADAGQAVKDPKNSGRSGAVRVAK